MESITNIWRGIVSRTGCGDSSGRVRGLRLLDSLKKIIFISVGIVLSGHSLADQERAQSAGAESAVATEAPVPGRPNILLIVADDLGYTDLGAWGGEIETPNLDALAQSGVMLTNFHVAPTCSPTRAMLLSGTDNHIAGLGNMSELLTPNQEGQPGYEGFLNSRIATLAELLRGAGYHTYMTGKWHLGSSEETSPAARGFDKSFAQLQGGAGHFDRLPLVGPSPAKFRENGKEVDNLPNDFYSTAFYAERLIEYIHQDAGDGKPFFGYLAYTAPHWPLQAPAGSIAKYRGRYESGYDALHGRRLQTAKERGVVPEWVKSAPRAPNEPAWTDLTVGERRIEARKMEIYAAMVDDLDVHTGRVIEYLRANGQLDNTFIFFMSDNGAEGHRLERAFTAAAEWAGECCDNSLENMGNADSYIWYGPNWARASTGAWRGFKGFTSQGGIHVPAFAHFPKAIKSGLRCDSFTTVMDVMPTLLELAGVKHPGATYKGRETVPMKGVSMMPMLRGKAERTHDPDYVMGWELFGKRAVRSGDWKIIYEPATYWAGRWELYNLAADPAEQHDLAQVAPAKLKEMVALWEQYARDNGVILPDGSSSAY